MIGGLSIVQLAIAVVIIAGVVALVWIALTQLKIPVPGWVQQVFWIIVIVFVLCAAIRLVASAAPVEPCHCLEGGVCTCGPGCGCETAKKQTEATQKASLDKFQEDAKRLAPLGFQPTINGGIVPRKVFNGNWTSVPIPGVNCETERNPTKCDCVTTKKKDGSMELEVKQFAEREKDNPFVAELYKRASQEFTAQEEKVYDKVYRIKAARLDLEMEWLDRLSEKPFKIQRNMTPEEIEQEAREREP